MLPKPNMQYTYGIWQYYDLTEKQMKINQNLLRLLILVEQITKSQKTSTPYEKDLYRDTTKYNNNNNIHPNKKYENSQINNPINDLYIICTL